MSASGDPPIVEPAPPTPPAPRVRGRKRRLARRWSRRFVFLAIAAVAGIFVTFFTIDIGNLFDLRHRAETYGGKYVGRPMHIGRLSARMTPGYFVLDDVVIEGLTPDARPFVRAAHIAVHVPWWTLFQRQLVVDVRMTDWTMTIEQWPDGHHSFPRIGGGGSSRKLPFTTTVNYVYADRGEFIYEDHGTPWSVDARNLNVDVVSAPNLLGQLGSQYVGRAWFTGGTVQIQSFLPMRTDLGASFVVEKGEVKLHRIDLVTDGAVSHLTGAVAIDSRWPEQTYQVESRLDFKRMRELFFEHESWRLSGDGRFNGTFHLFKGGRELKGDFSSALAGLNDLRFPNLRGSLDWLPDRFDVTNASADFFDGRGSFGYHLAHIGAPDGANATFDADYTQLDLGALGRYANLSTLDLAGGASGHIGLAWKNGHFHDTYESTGTTQATPPERRTVAARELPQPALIVLPDEGAFNDHKPLPAQPIAGSLVYHIDRTGIDFEPSWVAVPSSYVSFSGHVGPSGDALQLPVHITSKDWQASDRLLAAIMTERHVPTKAINVGGRGTFDGVLTESFNDLHTNGRFTGEAIWAFAVRWGRTVGDVAIADNYVTVKDAVVGDPAAATIGVNGRFSIGSHAVDDELRGTFKVSKWPLKDFRDAFGLTSWPVEGVGSADLDLHGPYRHLMGTGTLRIDNGSAWQEPFDVATSTLTFEGTGLFMGGLEMRKGAGRMRGQALINWDNTYSFDATGDHVAVESLQDFKVPSAPLSGQLDFRVRGAGSFDLPTYTFQGHVADLFAADEGIGDVTGAFTVRGNDLTFTELRAESRRVQATGLGRISLVKPYDAELTLTATNTSIDPYLKLFATEPLYTRAVVSGSVRIAGPLTDVTGLVVDARINDAALQLFDYNLTNDGQLHFTYSNDALSIDTFNLKGADTKLALTGSVSRGTRTVDLNLNGDANLAILQAFKGLGDLRVGGAGTLNAHLGGDFDQLRFSGQATLRDGRLRFPGLTRSLENVHGPITFSNGDLSFAGLRGAMGGGDIQFGGAVRFDGFKPVEYQLTAVGQSVQLRYPQGFESTATANLWMRGPVAAPTLGGDVEITRVRYLRPLSTDAGLIGLATAGGAAGAVAPEAPAEGSDIPIGYDVHVHARSMPFIETKDITIYGSVDDLLVRGTVSVPIITGRLDLDHGDFFFNGNRYRIVTGSIDFINPVRTEPFFDVQASTQAHVTGQTYTITGRVTGSSFESACVGSDCAGRVQHMTLQLQSEPTLSEYDILTLLLGGAPDPLSVERRSLDAPETAQRQLLSTMVTQLLTASITSRVGSVVGTAIPLDTIQFTPVLGSDLNNIATGTQARVTLGKAVSDKIFVTYSRDVLSAYELYLLEYSESDRVSWVLSRNEDHSFALDFRIRHVF